MTEFTLYSFALNLLYCFFAIVLLLLVLRLFDRSLGIKFKDNWNELKDQNNVAVAVYLGMRFVGCCLLLGFIIS